tara:strand:- start:544 stop:675 length:132 start_codon:yes stop_codon:yes gene_type:complete
VAETSGLLNRRMTQVVPRVRIPLSPPKISMGILKKIIQNKINA